jgi:4'-phosphopantetheinyl transferase
VKALTTAWRRSPEPPALDDGEVHVWRASLMAGEELIGRLGAVLADDEFRRAERFVFPRDRERFVVARGLLRRLLGGYLGVAPGALCFGYTEHGKPFLEAPPEARALSFNLSHSDAVALVAVTWRRRVGVDVERVRHDIQYDSIARSVFSAREYAALLDLPQEQRCAAFFTGWTRKEAYIKALGEGLSHPLDSFSVSLRPNEPAVLDCGADEADGPGWLIHPLGPAEGYVAAVVVEGPEAQFRLYDVA